MIKSFKHKGLQKFYQTGNTFGIQTTHSKKLRIRLAALDTATILKDLDLPGFRLHPLKGKKQNLWAIAVRKNWRFPFNFIDGDVYFVNYEDYPQWECTIHPIRENLFGKSILNHIISV